MGAYPPGLDANELRVSQYKENLKYHDGRASHTGKDFLHTDFQKWLSLEKPLLWLHGDGILSLSPVHFDLIVQTLDP